MAAYYPSKRLRVHAHEYCFYRARGLLPRFMRTKWKRSPSMIHSAVSYQNVRPVLLLASQINYAAVIDNFGLVSGRKIALLNLACQFNDNTTSESAYCLENFRSEDKEVSFTALFYDPGDNMRLNPRRYWNKTYQKFYELSGGMNDSFLTHCSSNRSPLDYAASSRAILYSRKGCNRPSVKIMNALEIESLECGKI